MTEETIGCPVCVSFSTVDDPQITIEAHNERRHDGEDVARIIQPDSEEDVDDFVKTARDLTPTKQYEELIRRIVRGNTPYTVATI